MNELKPCPVCGATQGLYILEDYHEFEWYVFCDNCKTSLCNENAQTKEEAIKYWNTRYERTCKRVEKDNPADNECSECGFYLRYMDSYCPNCGAKIVD